MFEGIVDEFDVVFDAEFFPDASVKSADGFYAQGEFGGNFLERLAGNDHVHDLELAVGEGFVRQSSGAREFVGESFSNAGAKITSPGHDAADRLDQTLGGSLFIKVAAGAGAQDTHGQLFLGSAA